MGLCGSKQDSGPTGNSTEKSNGQGPSVVKRTGNSGTTNKSKADQTKQSGQVIPKEENATGIKEKVNDKNKNELGESPLDKNNEEMKVLLLGAGESGKSTILQQLKILHQNGFSDKELYDYIPLIYNNIMEIGRDIIHARQKFEIENDNGLTDEEINEVLSFIFIPDPADPNKRMVFPDKFLDIIVRLWESKATQELLKGSSSSQFYIMDSAQYFMAPSNLKRIVSADYKPSLQDVLRSRQKTSGIFDTHISMGSNLKLHFFDVGGQRSERKKWIHCFDNVALIIFCVSLSEYDQFLMEDSAQNRFQESLILFENIVNSRWFARTSVVLFLNKIDLFAEKLKNKPLENYFPDYNGGSDINKATKYILWRFVQLNRANLNIYPHVTQATDTSNIKLVFAAIKETILENSLKDTGMLQ